MLIDTLHVPQIVILVEVLEVRMLTALVIQYQATFGGDVTAPVVAIRDTPPRLIISIFSHPPQAVVGDTDVRPKRAPNLSCAKHSTGQVIVIVACECWIRRRLISQTVVGVVCIRRCLA